MKWHVMLWCGAVAIPVSLPVSGDGAAHITSPVLALLELRQSVLLAFGRARSAQHAIFHHMSPRAERPNSTCLTRLVDPVLRCSPTGTSLGFVIHSCPGPATRNLWFFAGGVRWTGPPMCATALWGSPSLWLEALSAASRPR